MEDNYYKKGKDLSGGGNNGSGTKSGQIDYQRGSQSSSQLQQHHGATNSNNSKGRAKTQLTSKQQHNSNALKTNFNDLGKGRIVESSQSGFQGQQNQPKQTKHLLAASESWRKNSQPVSNDETVRGSSNQGGQQLANEMSANSNNQRRAGPQQRHSHDHFATLHQTPQPVIQPSLGSGSSTPLQHLIQRRQFEMTQLPKSNSSVSAGGQADNYTQQQILNMHLQNPKITSQTGVLGNQQQQVSSQQRTNNSAQKKMATLSALQTDLHHPQLDKNISTHSGGHLPSSHTRKISSGKQISKPQGGVFQSGPGKLKTGAGGPQNILTNNFMGLNPSHLVTAESPQFIHMHSGSEKFNFASQIESNNQATKSTGMLVTDHMKSLNNNNQKASAEVSVASKPRNFSNTGGLIAGSLTLHQQHSCGAPVTAHASHFNTPSNCYQAQQQLQSNNANNEGVFQRSSFPLTKDQMILTAAGGVDTNNNAHHLSQNSYEMTAPLHNISATHTPVGVGNRHATSNASLIGSNSAAAIHQNFHQHSNSTMIANHGTTQAQNTSAQNLPQLLQSTTANNNSQVVNFTQHTQQAHPNLQAAVQLHQQQQMSNAVNQQLQTGAGAILGAIASEKNPNVGAAQAHLSASQFDISALLRQQQSTTAHQPVFDFGELCSNTTHHAGHQTQAALKMSVEATTRDIDFLRQRFYAEHGCDTNDILTLYSYWQSNFQSFVQPGGYAGGVGGNQTTTINALQIANMSSYRQNPQHHHTITGPTGGGTKSNNVTAFGSKSRHTTVNQHQTINFNSQSFDNQTMTTSHIQPRKVTKLLELGAGLAQQATSQNTICKNQLPITQTAQTQARGDIILGGQDSTEIQHFTAGSIGGGYTPFGEANQQMFFVAPNSNPMEQAKGRRTQPCIRQHSTVSNRQNCTDTVSFHRDVPTPMNAREALASVEAEDEKNEFSFEEPAIDGTNEHSIEEEEKSLINALSFKKQIIPLIDGQNLHEIDNQRGWATTKQETTPSLPKYRNAPRPLSKDQCGFTIQLSPINRFAPEPSRSKRSLFDFCTLKPSTKSLLHRGMQSAKRRIKKKGSTNKDGARKYLHRHLQMQTKTLLVLTRCQTPASCIFRLKQALEVIFLNGGTSLAAQEQFKRLMPKRRDYDSTENKTTTCRGDEHRNHSDVKRRRDKSTKGRGTSKSRKRQGSRNSRKQRIASLYRESTSSIGDESANIPIFSHLNKDGKKSEVINVVRPISQVVQDAETTQDIQKLCKEIEAAEKNFAEKLNQDEDQFDKQMTQQVVQAERALQESKRESQTRELSMRGTRRESQLNLASRANFKAQSLSSLNQAMQMPAGMANATQRHLNPSELYGTEGRNMMAQYAQTNDPAAPNTERPNAQSIEMRLALHHQTQQQKKNDEARTGGTMADKSEPRNQAKGKKINVVSLLDQKSEPCLLKPKKLALDKQGVKLFAGNTDSKAQSAQKEQQLELNSLDTSGPNKLTKNDRWAMAEVGPSGATGQQTQNNTAAQTSTNSMNSKRRLTFIKTKNINFHSLSKLSGRMQPSATSTHQAAPGLRIKLQKTANGDSTDRSGPTTDMMRFAAAQATCQSALATHKHTGKDLSAARATHLSMQSSNTQQNMLLINGLGKHQNTATVTDQSDSGVTPDKPTFKTKYASARIKLLRVDTSQDDSSKVKNKANNKNINVHGTAQTPNTALQHMKQQASASNLAADKHQQQPQDDDGSPTNSSATSTLGGFRHIRRLVEMLINEFYRKRGKSIKTVQREKQVDTLVEFWWQSLSQQKILGKLKGKLAKTGLVEKEKHLMNFLNGKDKASLFNLQKHSTTRKYGELAVVEEKVLRLALEDYLTQSQPTQS